MKIELLEIFKLEAQQNQLIDWALFFLIMVIAIKILLFKI